MERSYVQDYNIKSYLAHTSLYESARKNEKISLQFATKHTCECHQMKLIKFTFVFFVNENPKAAVSDQWGSFGLNLALALVEDGMPVKF